MNTLANKVALISGGASGIGRATAILFAQEGAAVVVADINGEQGKAVVDEIEIGGREGGIEFLYSFCSQPLTIKNICSIMAI